LHIEVAGVNHLAFGTLVRQGHTCAETVGGLATSKKTPCGRESVRVGGIGVKGVDAPRGWAERGIGERFYEF